MCSHTFMSIDMLTHEKSGIDIWIAASFQRAKMPLKMTKSLECFHGNCSTLSIDNSLFLTNRFSLIHKFPDDSNISLIWCLDSRKKVLDTSGPSCNCNKETVDVRCPHSNWRVSHSLSGSTLIMKPYGHPQCSPMSWGPRILRCLKSVASWKKCLWGCDCFSMTSSATSATIP